MKIEFHNEFSKKYVELLPMFAFSWYTYPTVAFGWLCFVVTIEFRKLV